jgi:ubiquinone/menaquinone biosynthesis methyltransferase
VSLPVAKGEGVRDMFDRIAPRYDLLNRLLTGGLDEVWRRRAVRALDPGPDRRYLDLCAGTLDLSAHVLRRQPSSWVVAADYSSAMLERGLMSNKIPSKQHLRTVVADAHDLPFAPASFDGGLCGFGMRNLADLDGALAQLARVLKPGARFCVLEFFRPETDYERRFHRVVNRSLVPTVGRLISRDREAYRYLGASMEDFDSRTDFGQRAGRVGFRTLRARRLFPGVASLVVLEREPEAVDARPQAAPEHRTP